LTTNVLDADNHQGGGLSVVGTSLM
jgi:hypothetical protein